MIALCAAILFPVFSRSRLQAHRAQCDVRLKAIALALDAFRQEKGKFPQTLEELRTEGYLNEPDALRCPDDPRPLAQAGYEDYYVIRGPRDPGDLPILICPFHEESGFGSQAYKGRYTTQFAGQKARIVSCSSVTVQRPGKQAIAAAAGMTLRGGDRLTVGSSGSALVEFIDGSTASLEGGSDVTVLQSFYTGTTKSAPLYTLVKQTLGKATYTVHHGSPFDVATPTATAGARGTQFTVTVKSDGTTDLLVISGKVIFSTLNGTGLAPLNNLVGSLLNGKILGGLLSLL